MNHREGSHAVGEENTEKDKMVFARRAVFRRAETLTSICVLWFDPELLNSLLCPFHVKNLRGLRRLSRRGKFRHQDAENPRIVRDMQRSPGACGLPRAERSPDDAANPTPRATACHGPPAG